MNSDDYKLEAKTVLKKILGRYRRESWEPMTEESDIEYFVNFTVEAARQSIKEEIREKIGVRV